MASYSPAVFTTQIGQRERHQHRRRLWANQARGRLNSLGRRRQRLVSRSSPRPIRDQLWRDGENSRLVHS
jgi:hypothetical protein